MKTIFFLLSFFFASTIGLTQVWAPAGATWHYDWVSFGVSGYIKIQYTGDTTVAGKSCKILKKERHSYDWSQHTYSTELIGLEYTYEENNTVYYYRNNHFFKLYDFNSIPGGTWEISGWGGSLCDSIASVVVDTTGIIIINSVSLKCLKVAGQTSPWEFTSDTIIERIGSLGYMFPEPNCIPDVYEGGILRCYYDDSFGLYERGLAPSCDYITGVGDKFPESNIVKIHPVPASLTITVELAEQVRDILIIEISDILGNKIKRLETDQAKVTIPIEDLKGGIYFISITDKRGLFWNQKFIKN